MEVAVEYSKFSALEGLTLSAIDGAVAGSDEITFRTTSGEQFIARHDQCCCEAVAVLEVVGDVADLVGSPLLQAEEVTSSQENPPEVSHFAADEDSFTWTFYKLATIKGSVTIRWYGESNGYYSEDVDFYRATPRPVS